MKAIDFTLPDQDGHMHTLSDYHGSWVVLYFYPKDNTPGCTEEACQIRDLFPEFKTLDAKVLGISVDSVESHKKFVTKYSLPFTLLADVDKKVVGEYGVWQKKKFMGREYMGIVRTTFLINPEGEIVKKYEQVKPAEHAKELLNDLKEFS